MRALAWTLTLVAATAHAGWRAATIAGTPRDVTIPDAGLVVVATNGGGGMALFALPGDGGVPVSVQQAAGNYVSAAMRGPCLMGFTGTFAPAGNLVFDNVCTANYALNTTGGRVRVNASGAAYTSTANGVTILSVFRLDPTAAPTAAGNWTQLVTGGATASSFYPLASLGLDGGDWSAIETQPAGTPTLTFYKSGTQAGTVAVGAIRDLALFERNGTAGAMVVNDVMQVVEVDDIVGGQSTPVTLPAQVYTSVGYTEKNASLYGRGFGMLTSGTQVWSPVPNPNAPGRVWVQRATQGATPTTLTRVTCFDPSWCAGIAGAGAGNVLAYSNDNPPASDQKPLTVTAGATSIYALDAGDLDGDPIWVTWVDGGFVWDGGSPFAVSVAGPPPSCSVPSSLPPLIAILSDGYAPHDRQITINVAVSATAAVAVPLFASPASLTQTAGTGLADTVTVTTTPDSGCVVPALTWSVSGDAGFVLMPGAGNTVQIAPPVKFCSASPQTFQLTGAGAPDASVAVPVTLNPWGAANPPAFAVGTQAAGTSAMYVPQAAVTHACATTAGFPGTDLVWSGIDAGGNPTITVTPGTAALTVTSSDACVGGSVTAQARRSVTGTAPAQISATAGQLDVTIVPSWQPITAATPFDAGFFYDAPASLLRGDFSVGTNCVADRGLTATVLVDRADGGLVTARINLPVPGPWSVPIPGGCNGGNFVALASLIDDGGTAIGPQPRFAFSSPRLPAHVPPLVETEAPVSCAGGAGGTLNLALDPADCAAQKFSWAGDAISASDGGPRATFAVPANDLQAQAGRTLQFTITASVGAGNTDTQVRSVKLVPERFVEVTHRSDVPVAREEESLGVEVTLTNPTACAVSGVTLREALGGLKVVAGSVHVEGAPAESTATADVLEVPNLSIAARGATKVRYLARVPLLSAARPLGVVTFAGTDVTVQTGLPGPAAGCGCTSAPVGALAFAAIAWALLRSRRQKR